VSTGERGLGLAIVGRLAAASGGSARLSDAPGGGLTVTIDLLLARPSRTPRRPAAGIRGPTAQH
jgi:signal transduction histidine kinase